MLKKNIMKDSRMHLKYNSKLFYKILLILLDLNAIFFLINRFFIQNRIILYINLEVLMLLLISSFIVLILRPLYYFMKENDKVYISYKFMKKRILVEEVKYSDDHILINNRLILQKFLLANFGEIVDFLPKKERVGEITKIKRMNHFTLSYMIFLLGAVITCIYFKINVYIAFTIIVTGSLALLSIFKIWKDWVRD